MIQNNQKEKKKEKENEKKKKKKMMTTTRRKKITWTSSELKFSASQNYNYENVAVTQTQAKDDYL